MDSKMKNKGIWTIPNLLSFFRLALIPVIIWLYVGKGEHIWTLAILALSAATDIVDGIIARKCNMVSDFGKALDPVADKLTQLAMLACLISRFPKMLWLFILLAVKECMTGIMSLVAIKKSNAVLSSEWHGKLTTVLLYTTMMLHLLWYTIPGWLSDGLISCCMIMMVYSAIQYFVRNIRQINQKENAHDPA